MILASFLTTILSITIVTVCVLLIGLVLLQKNRGAGLSGAFGGVGGHSAFGTKTGDMLTWVTVALAAVFLVLAVIANYFFVPETPMVGSPAAQMPFEAEQLPGTQAPAPVPTQAPAPVSPTPMQGPPPSPTPQPIQQPAAQPPPSTPAPTPDSPQPEAAP